MGPRPIVAKGFREGLLSLHILESFSFVIHFFQESRDVYQESRLSASGSTWLYAC